MDLDLSSLQMPIRLKPGTPMTDEDFLAFSAVNEPLRMEREPDGEMLIMTPTGARTGRMNQRIGRLLDEWAEADGRGVTFDSSTGFKLKSGAVRSPNTSWVSNSAWEALSPAERDTCPPICPEFVVELVSPKDQLESVRKKMEEWLASGAELAWLINSKRRAVEVYRVGEAAEVHENPTSVQGTGCMSGFCLVMERVWGLA
jgi:Uma2 family endonuclease